MSDQTVHWYQEESGSVSAWEFQAQVAGSHTWEWVTQVGPADPCPSCFEAVISVPRKTILVRSRSFGPDGFSEWSVPRHLPEPGFTLCLAVSLLCIALFNPLKSRSSRRDNQVV